MSNVKVPFVDLSIMHKPITDQMQKAIGLVIEKGDFILGKAVAEFETAFAAACGVKYAVGVASGTDAIALGLRSCGIGEGDEVIVPTNTFIATVIGVIEAGGKPILADCDPVTALIDLDQVEKLITPSTKAIIPVHLYGQLVSPKKLIDLANKHNLIIFEDAAQAHLASREGYRAGMIGKAAGFSFYPAKNLGALGDGGMVVTNDLEVAEKLKSIRNYGSPRKYLHTEYGINSRLDTLQAAILKIKLEHLSEWNRLRNLAAQKYDELLAPLKSQDIIPIKNESGEGHIYHLYVIKLGKNCPIDRQTMMDKLLEKGIQTGIHYPICCHLQPGYKNLGYVGGDFPEAESLADEILSLPMYPGIDENQINLVVNAIQQLTVISSQ